MNFSKLVGKKLQEGRKAKGYTQQGIADLLGMKQQQYARYESGVNELNYQQIYDYCTIFEITPDFLFSMGDFQDGTNYYSLDFNTPQPPAMPSNEIFIPPDIVGHVHSYHIPARSGEATDVTIDPETDAKVTAILRKLDENDEQDN